MKSLEIRAQVLGRWKFFTEAEWMESFDMEYL